MAYTPDQFADALLASVAEAIPEAEKVVGKGSNNIKGQARRNVLMTAPVHNAHAHEFINYDVDANGPVVTGEIGYDRRRGGRLGNLLEFGGGGDHSPPHHDLSRALAKEEPGFTEAIADMGERLIPG